MSGRVSNFSDLIQRATASCLLHPLACGVHEPDEISDNHAGEDSEDERYETDENEEEEEDDDGAGREREEFKTERMTEMEMLMGEVFDAVSAMKRAYVSLQAAHSPWDPDKMRAADAAVVAELRTLGVMRERFRRGCGAGGGRRRSPAAVRELVAPYEAAVEELKREVKAKEVEVDNLREKLRTATVLGGGKIKAGRSHSLSHQSKRKLSCSQPHVATSPAPELFEATMSLVIEASKSFTSLLLSLMRSAHWDIVAAIRSMEPTTATTIVEAHHAKFALGSYVSRKIFQGFDHETFYMDGSLTSLLHPDQFRRDCFTQYRDMKAMDPTELLGVLPTCPFGNFCSKKYLAILHPKMEESLFGDLEQRRQVLAGNHPRTQFYGEFLALAKPVWLLHLLAFSMDPPPSHFEASRGAEFHPQYMESVSGSGRQSSGHVVGFPVSPGFKLGNGSVIKARVYLVPKTT